MMRHVPYKVKIIAQLEHIIENVRIQSPFQYYQIL